MPGDRRTVSVVLAADISQFQSSLAKAAASAKTLGDDAGRYMAPGMRRAGERSGGLMAEGFRTGFIRNSPVIAAAVGAALAAGAPVALAGAGILFGGIGAIAAAQSTRVRDAWTDLGHGIRDGAIEDAAALVPVYEEMANKIGAAFQRMRPEIRDAFDAAAPQIERFTDGLTGAAENALPGLVRAIEQGGPVIDGLTSLMEDVGTGLSDFFDAMSDNSEAAGQALAAIGDTLEVALPLLGELLGTGAQIAADVLPPLADGLGLVLDVVRALGPILPSLALGFASFKAASVAAGYMQTFAVQAQYATTAMSGSAAAGARVGGALSGMGRALPAVGIAVGAVGAIMQIAQTQTDAWAQALLDGGAAAEEARRQTSELAEAWNGLGGTAAGAAPGMEGFALALGIGANAERDAEQAARDLYNAMSPLDQAQQNVTFWTNELEQAVGSYGSRSDEARAASDRLALAQSALELRQRAVEAAAGSAGGAAAIYAAHLEDAAEAADDAKAATDRFKFSLDILTGAHVSMIEVESAFQAAVAEASGALEGMNGTVLDSAGGLNLQSESGRAAADVLLGVRDSGNQLIATMIEQGATAEAVRTQDAELRASFINTAVQMGISQQAALNLADQILGIPAERETTITADTQQATAAVSSLQAQIDGLRGRTVDIIARAIMPDLNGSVSGSGRPGFAEGGWTGPGSKYQPAGIVHADEFVVPKSRVRALGGPRAVGSLVGMPGYAEGGPVGGLPVSIRAELNASAYDTQMNALARQVIDRYEPVQGLIGALQFARSQVGRPYIWGGVGPAGYDCSGFMSAITNVARGRNPHSRVGSTASFPWGGFASGYGSFTIGSTPNAGGGIGHMAGTLLGINVESTGGVGVKVGGSARGASNGLFGTRAHLAMANGGVIGEPVFGVGLRSGGSYSFGERGPETVTPGIQSREFSGGGRSGVGASPAMPAPQVTVHFHVDGEEFRGMTRTEIDSALDNLTDSVHYATGR